MKKFRKLHIKKNLILALGLLLAIVLVSEQVSKYQLSDKVNISKVTEHGSDEDSSKEVAFLDVEQEFITTSGTVSPDFKSFEIMEIVQNEEDGEAVQLPDFIQPGYFIKALFRKVVSPNAP